MGYNIVSYSFIHQYLQNMFPLSFENKIYSANILPKLIAFSVSVRSVFDMFSVHFVHQELEAVALRRKIDSDSMHSVANTIMFKSSASKYLITSKFICSCFHYSETFQDRFHHAISQNNLRFFLAIQNAIKMAAKGNALRFESNIVYSKILQKTGNMGRKINNQGAKHLQGILIYLLLFGLDKILTTTW